MADEETPTGPLPEAVILQALFQRFNELLDRVDKLEKGQVRLVEQIGVAIQGQGNLTERMGNAESHAAGLGEQIEGYYKQQSDQEARLQDLMLVVEAIRKRVG